MNRIISHLLDMLPYIILSIPFVIIGRIIILLINKKEIDWRYEKSLLVFCLFLAGLFSQAFTSNNVRHITNFIPFKILFDTYNQVFNKGNMNYFLISFLGNIIVFIPIGFFIKVLWNPSNRETVLIGFSISLFIEIVQLFLNRTSDIDDLILNTLGVILGIILYKFLIRFKKESSV